MQKFCAIASEIRLPGKEGEEDDDVTSHFLRCMSLSRRRNASRP